MGMTATQLGSQFNRGAAAMNLLLRDHGFLEGRPGAWQTTELGKKFAQSHDFDNGYGGYAHRSWGWLSWRDDLVDALKASLEANPDGVATVIEAPTSIVADAARPGSGAGIQGSGMNKWLVAAGVGLVVVSAPAVKNVWNRKVRPAAAKTWARVTERTPAQDAAEAPEDSAEKPQGR